MLNYIILCYKKVAPLSYWRIFLTTLIFLSKNYLNKQFNSLYYFKFDLFGLCLKVNYFSLKINDMILMYILIQSVL